MSWKKISSKEIYKNRWLRVTEDQVETDLGRQLTYGVVHKEPYALIIPWDGKYLTLVGQYRYLVNSFSWEFPSGHFENGSIEHTASEELREETGLTASQIREIGSFWIGPGAITQECRVFLATGLSEGEVSREESEEGMEIKKVTVEDFRQMVLSGQIKDGPSIAAFNIFLGLPV